MKEVCHSPAAQYNELILRHERRLRWLCLRRTHGDITLADDYFQEVALTLWKHLPEFPLSLPRHQENAYIKQVALKVLANCSRKKSVDLRKLQIEMVTALDRQKDENEQLLNTFAAALPEKYRSVVALYRSGYELSEIAHFLDLTPNTVRQQLHRATVMMRDMYEKENQTINNLRHGQ